MTENSIIPLFILAITFPTVTIFPLLIVVLNRLAHIEGRLGRIEREQQ